MSLTDSKLDVFAIPPSRWDVIALEVDRLRAAGLLKASGSPMPAEVDVRQARVDGIMTGARDGSPKEKIRAFDQICALIGGRDPATGNWHDATLHLSLPKSEATILPAPVFGSEMLCPWCAKVFCPHGERAHFFHDGCPACDSADVTLKATFAAAQARKAEKPPPGTLVSLLHAVREHFGAGDERTKAVQQHILDVCNQTPAVEDGL